MKYIIIPDVHGRTFWKQAVKKAEKDDIVIFLGDYLEPYTDYEGITHQMAYDNFKQIVRYKRAHSDNTILLLGNHDFACIDRSMISCRHDRVNEERNHKYFMKNIDLFKLVHTVTINNNVYVFSHSGIHKDWICEQITLLTEDEDVRKKLESDDIEYITSYLNDFFKENYRVMLHPLHIYSNYRGWSFFNYGSCIWADCREWSLKNAEYENTYQIFGHTQLDSQPIVTDFWSNLDCRRAFILNSENGELTELDGKVVEKTKIGDLEDE